MTSSPKLEVVYVTTFYSPDLFWFISDKSIEERNQFTELFNKDGCLLHRIENANERQRVAVKHGHMWVRAEIIHIGLTATNTNEYVCWLTDYGVFIEVLRVFELPLELTKLKPFVTQGKLDGLKCVEPYFDYDEQKLMNLNCNSWLPGITNVVNNLLNKVDIEIKFEKRHIVDNVHIGRLHLSGSVFGDLNEYIIATKLAKEVKQNCSSDLFYSKQNEVSLYNVYNTVKHFSINYINKQVESKLSCGRGVFRTSIPNVPPGRRVQDWLDKEPFLASGKIVDDIFDDSERDFSELKFPKSQPTPKGRAKLLEKALGKTNKVESDIIDNNIKFSRGRGFAKSDVSSASTCSSFSNKLDFEDAVCDLNESDKLSIVPAAQSDVVLKFSPAGSLLHKKHSMERKSAEKVVKKAVAPTKHSGTDMKMSLTTSLENGNKSEDKCSEPEITQINTGATKQEIHTTEDATSYERHPNCQQPEIELRTGKCKCSSCESWRSSYMVFQPLNSLIKSDSKVKPSAIIKPALLFKTEQSTETPLPVKATKKFQSDYEKTIAPHVVVHGHFIPRRVDSLCLVPFHPDVQLALKQLNYNEVMRVQKYAWPAVLRGHHTIIVNGPNSGKTMVYVPALCTFLTQSIPELMKEIGPLAIVLCPGVQVAENVANLMENIARRANIKKCIRLVVPPFNDYHKNNLQEKVDVLICTPTILMEIIRQKIIKLKRLCYLILESANELFDKYPSEMKILLAVFQKTLMNRKFNHSIQMVVTSQEWSKSIEQLCKQLIRMPLVCIGSYLEAALYGRADIQVQFVKSVDKPGKILDIVTDKYQVYKTLIICKNIDDIEMTLDFLKSRAIDFMALHQDFTENDIVSVKKRWFNAVCGNYFVLVCSDEIFNTSLGSLDASVIVQFSLPESWSQFAFRFSPFMDNYSSPLTAQKDTLVKCKMHIFVDEENCQEFPKVVKLLKRMKCNLPPNILKLCNDYETNLEMSKISNHIELCNNLKLFGKCETAMCSLRHLVSPIADKSKLLPSSGLVKLKMLHIQDVTKFFGRLLEYTDSNGIVHSVESDYATLLTAMVRCMKEKERKSVLEVKIGNLYAVEESEGIFRRCRVIEVLKEGFLKRAATVRVQLLDTGATLNVSTTKLYLLPKPLEDIPPQAIEIYIANLGPLDKDTAWSDFCRNKIRKECKNAGYEEYNCFCTGRIKLQLNNTLWVDNLVLQESLDNGALVVNRLSIKNKLRKFNLVEERPEHLERLYKLCEDCEIVLPDYSLPIVKPTNLIKPQQEPRWAHLENYQEYNLVRFSTGVSPDLFFVLLQKNEKTFRQLQADIQSEINKPLYITEFSVCEGRCYLAKDPAGNTFERVIVQKLTDDIADCFFVDFGDKTSVPVAELKFLPDEFITKLPFQVIECKLWGVQPKRHNWLSGATDLLYDFAFEPNTDIVRFLNVKVMEAEQPGITGYKKYSVILVDNAIDNVIINNLVIERGFGLKIEGQLIDVEFDKLINYGNNCEADDNEIEDTLNCGNSNFEFDCSNEDDLGRWDVQLNDHTKFFSDVAKKTTTKDLKPKKPQRSLESKDVKVPILPADCSTPNVVWYQKEDHVILMIQLVDIKNYDLHVWQKRLLIFRTDYKGTLYKLNLNLFSKVDNDAQHQAFGMYVYVKLKKQTPAEWPRLVLEKERLRYIKYKFDALSIETDSEDETPLPKHNPNNQEANKEDDDNESFVYEYDEYSDDESDIYSGSESSNS